MIPFVTSFVNVIFQLWRGFPEKNAPGMDSQERMFSFALLQGEPFAKTALVPEILFRQLIQNGRQLGVYRIKVRDGIHDLVIGHVLPG